MRDKEPQRKVLNAVARVILSKKVENWERKADEHAKAVLSARDKTSAIVARLSGRSAVYEECAKELRALLEGTP